MQALLLKANYNLIATALAGLENLHNSIVNATSTTKKDISSTDQNIINGFFKEFMSAYNKLPRKVKDDLQNRFDMYNNWWSNTSKNLKSEEYKQQHSRLQKGLALSLKNANKEKNDWDNKLRKIFRNLQISIDSSIVPLHQTEILNFEEDTTHVKPFNKANYMYKSIRTLKDNDNSLFPPIDLLFRPSTYSLFSHILFNSNEYVRTCYDMQPNPTIFQVVTGTPGIGKSAIRMPLLTLTMSLGANEVKTARRGEPSFIFRNQNPVDFTYPIPCDFDEQSDEFTPLPPIGSASITINRENEPPIHITRDTFCYTYNVFMCESTSTNEEYDPKEIYSSEIPLGELTVPSIHHFPHFFRLFVNKDNQVENRLRGAKWHIVDDFILKRSKIPHCEHVVLLTSPNKERWEDLSSATDHGGPIILYNVPTLLFPEVIHIFNAIPCRYQFNTEKESLMMEAQDSIQEQGMILRNVLDPQTIPSGNLTSKSSQDPKTRTKGDFFGREISHRYIQSSSPQFDPMNWFIQHATQDSYKIIQERTTRKINKSVELNIVPRDRKDSTSSVKGAQHEQSVMSAVEKGIVLKGLKPISSDEFPESSISFPQTKYSLSQEMSDACVIKTIFIPDPDCLHEYQTQAYQPKWDFLFQHCLHKEALYSISSRMKTIKELDTDTAYVSGKHRPKSSDEMTVITSHLIPNDARNAGFDSILLMFRCKKDPFDLHSLGVLFLQDTTGATHGISPGGVVLMKKWCYILETRYRLKRVQIFPSYIVVANGNNYKSFTLINKKNLGQFIPEQNIWIAKFEAHGEIEVGYDTIPPMTASASPILDRALDEEVNKNPHAVRCAYCRSLVTENFPDHFCGGMSEKTIRVKVNEKLIGVLEHSKNPDIQPTEEPVHIENLAEDISDNLVTDPSDIKPRKPSSKLPSTIQSPPHRKEYVEITYTNGIPGNPDVYRMPFLPPPSTMITQSAQSLSRSIDAPHQPNDVRPDASSQPLPDRLNDPSRIREAHLLWVEGYILSYQELGTYRFKPIKLAKQPFHSLRFDEPGTDVTDITHNAQYMLPSVTNDRFTPLDFITETGTAFISSKRVEYEYFWQWLNRKNPLTGMVVALQADEIELTKRIQKCEDENEKSRLTCLIAKVLLLRSRLYIQSGALTTAQWFFERSKQHMVLNDTAEVEYELILARSNGREISPRGSDELNRIIVNARNCFGINWEQWIQEGQNLPILLNPSYHRLQYHLKQVQDHVNTLRSRLKSIVDPGPMTNDPRRATMEEALPQTLKEGLTLQLLIAWKTGYRDQLEFFQNELNSTFQNEGDKTIKAMTTPFKSQKRQIERLDIAVVTKAINDILTTTQNHFNTLHVLESTNGVEMMIGDHSSISITPSIHRSIQQDIHTTTQLLIDRISAIKTASCQKLKHTGNTVMTNALEQMAEELNPILITTSNHDADMEAVEDTSSNVMLTEESEEEPSLPEEPRAKFNENSFGKGKRANKTVSTQYDTTQTIYHCSYFESQEDDKESNDIKYFRKHLGAANVVNTNGDGNCWLYAIYDQLTYDELVSAGFLLLTHDKCSNDAMCYFKSQVRSRMVHTMRGNMDGVVTFLTGLNSETPEDYIDRQLKDGQWGGDAELSTVCRVIQRQIAVYYPNDNPVFVYAPDPTLPTVDIGHCGGNHFVSLHSVPIINKTGFKKLHTKVQTLTKPKVIVNKLKRSQPTTPEKEPPTAETDDNQTRTPKRPKKKDDQSEKSSIPSMPLFNVIP